MNKFVQRVLIVCLILFLNVPLFVTNTFATNTSIEKISASIKTDEKSVNAYINDAGGKEKVKKLYYRFAGIKDKKTAETEFNKLSSKEQKALIASQIPVRFELIPMESISVDDSVSISASTSSTCKYAGYIFWAYNNIGLATYKYGHTFRFCYANGKVTSVSNKAIHAQGIDYSPLTSYRYSGAVNEWDTRYPATSYTRYTQGRFDGCIVNLACPFSYYPTVKTVASGKGTFTYTYTIK